ncbi:sulfatase-like hydrolase/transferase [Cocleimonas sp. KMM 6892]|uniref:sulfatase-like hydrolase/transferase n=1 Tax=unclassified Cocleimonas TaxID=2639732 RepID=UPI002DBDB7CC|nr:MULTISPECIES: sulfatase-like hydrolase/transferase [unclassified Cocleimonas]MEB8431771.1 sulfatase-like hydrolase/transferase [Cocleimonas sp. KMM 6892]MEC4715143.1 sulfatase-like hydrolase/transferase [Cocleimonas sp. KMM 6895]MEC4744043.1 sulfatase-like hydrolase/transferase [Cocleimonas sp. KMM 6896]
MSLSNSIFYSARFWLKVATLLVFVLFTNQGFNFRLEYLIETNNTTTIIVFAFLWLFSLLILLLVTFQQNTLIRLFWALVIAATTAVSYGFYAAGGSELEVLDVLELWQARHETGRAFEHFHHAVIKAGIVAFIGFVIIAYPPPKLTGRARTLLTAFAWLPIVPLLMFVALIFIKSDRAVAGLPQQLSPISIATAVGYKLSVQEIPKRKTVEDKPKYAAKVKHLVYLVDESINPDYVYTSKGKLLDSFMQNQDKIANFGTAVSGSNCSARSNAILRLGATRDNLIESVRTSPTIWQYAKKAGFRTVYIDSQASEKTVTKPNDFQNYMTSEEAKLIDKFYKVKNVEGPDLDYRLLEIMEEELQSDKPTFIYANKNGAHFPYDDNYPKSAEIYLPVPTGEENRGLDGLMELYADGSMEPVINTYKNSIYWTVDKFFEKLFNEVDLSDTAIIYTSDHGQYFEPSSTTHCTSGENAPATEGLVPLMVMTDKKPLLSNFVESAATNYNRTDQFSLFPTVLDLLGYSEELQNQYGPDLLDPILNNVSAFNTGDILGVISKDTVWREVSQQERIQLVPNAPLQAPLKVQAH